MGTPQPELLSARRRAALALRLGVLVQAIALAWLAVRHGTAIDSVVFVELQRPEATARRWDLIAAAVGLAAALWLLVRPAPIAAWATALVFLIVAVATRWAGGRAFSHLAPLAHAPRWLAPLAIPGLFTLAIRPVAAARSKMAEWTLRVAVAAAFCAHGWEAFGGHPAFVDLLLGSTRRWLDFAPSETAAARVLTGIALVDALVAIGILVLRRPGVALWAACWGFATALSRMVALGPEFASQSALRALNGCAPLALWFLWRHAARNAHLGRERP